MTKAHNKIIKTLT